MNAPMPPLFGSAAKTCHAIASGELEEKKAKESGVVSGNINLHNLCISYILVLFVTCFLSSHGRSFHHCKDANCENDTLIPMSRVL